MGAAEPSPRVPRSPEPSVDDVMAALIGSNVLETLEISNDDLARARSDTDLLETLRITYALLIAFEGAGVLDTFFHLPRRDQADFLRWIGATDDIGVREDRTATFVSALQAAPLAWHEASEGKRGSARLT